MAGVNKVILIGNLGRDPEVRAFEGGRKVANFSVATSEVFKDKEGNRQERTEWHNVSVWGQQAETAEKYLRKGSKVYLEGKLRTREYEKDNIKRYSTEIMVDNFTMLDSRPEGGGGEGGSGGYTGQGGSASGNQQQSSGSSSGGQGNNSPMYDQEPDDLPF
jgi:single-strand DNA-binding protein